MLIMFIREMKALFRSIKSVCCMALFIMASAFFFISNDLSTGYSAIQPVFTNMSLVAAALIPPVAIFSVDRDRGEDNKAFLESLPVSKTRIVLAKLLAVFTFFMIPTATMALYPLILSFVGASNMAQGYVTFLPFVLCVAFFVAMSFLIGAAFKNKWVALGVNYAVSVVLFVLGLIAVLFGGAVESVLRWVSPFRRFDPIVFDILDLSSVLFYISLAVLFTFIAVKLLTLKREKLPVMLCAVLTVCTLVINVGASLLPQRMTELDVSVDDIYQTSDATSDFLKGLKDDVTVYLIDPDNDVKLETYIKHYCEQSDRITLVEIDSASNPEFLKKYGIDSSALGYSMVVESARRWKFIDSSECFSYYYYGESEYIGKGFMSVSEYLSCGSYYTQMFQYYQQYGDDTEMLSTIYQTIESLAAESISCFNPELALTPAIEYVTKEHVPTVYFISNHGEKNTASNPLDISKLKSMPEDAKFIIINNPDKDYSDSEIAALLKFSESGGRLLVLTDKTSSGFKNIAKLLSSFGLSAKSDVLTLDGSTTVEATVNEKDGSFMADYGLGTVTVSDANVIEVSEGSDFEVIPLLSVETAIEVEGENEGETKTETKDEYLAVAATLNGAPRLVWLTAADTYANKDTESMSDEALDEYTKALYLTRGATQWLKVSFSSAYAEGFNPPAPYSALIIEIGSGASVFVGCLFMGLIPLMLVGRSFLRTRMRKKRSSAPLISE